MVLAMMDSESKEWYALGKTKAEAMYALMQKWNSIQQSLVQNGWKNEPEYFHDPDDLDREYGITIVEIKPGQCIVW